MPGIQPAGERAESGKDQLSLRSDEAAARDAPAVDAEPKLGMKMAGNLGAMLVAKRFVAEQDSAELDLVDDGPAAMVGK